MMGRNKAVMATNCEKIGGTGTPRHRLALSFWREPASPSLERGAAGDKEHHDIFITQLLKRPRLPLVNMTTDAHDASFITQKELIDSP